MRRNYFSLLLAAMVALSGCTKDQTVGNGGIAGEDDGNYVFLDVDMQLPTENNTRSKTDWENPAGETDKGTTNSDGDGTNLNDDYEYGWDYENEVRTMILVITDTSENYIMHSVVNTVPATQKGQNSGYDVTVAAKFKRSDLATAYAEGGKLANSKQVHLYAFCNYTQELLEHFNTISDSEKKGAYSTEDIATSWMNWSGNLNESVGSAASQSIWGKRAFLMTNARIKTAELPATIDAWSNYTSEDKPFHLSGENGSDPNNGGDDAAIKVERTAARLDFKDGSSTDTDPNTYKLTDKYTTTDSPTTPTDVNLFTIELTEMSLVNMSNEYYYLRRVSANGTNSAWSVGAYETKNNYVVDTDWQIKQNAVTAENMSQNFNFRLFSATVDDAEGTFERGEETIYEYNTAGWYTSQIADVLNGENDTWAQSGGKYHIWRYVTENTIPQDAAATSTSNNNQKVGYTTGIVFRGKITAGDNIDAKYTDTAHPDGKRFVSESVKSALANPTNESTVLYMYGGLLYASFDEMVKEAIIDGEGSPLYNLTTGIISHWYVKYTEEEFNPANGSEFNFEYKATAPAASDSEHYLQLNLELYNALMLSDGTEYNKEPEAAPETPDHPMKKFFDNKSKFKYDGELTFDGTTKNRNFKNLATTNNITIYETSQDSKGNWGYYCYYFYWNRHNDNGNNALMGPMEFATVRNNVYKLAVTKIGRIGHPVFPEDDPDPIDPNDPDEEDKVYMDVEIEVLPWVVRVNNIEF